VKTDKNAFDVGPRGDLLKPRVHHCD
jgi:hypothetical protein